MTALPWLQPVLKFFFMKYLKIAARGLHIPSLYGTLAPVLNIIAAIKFGYLPPIQFALEKLSWFPHKLITSTGTATDIIMVTTKDLTAALKQTNKNTLLPLSDTITHKAPFKLDSIFYNASSALKSQQSPIFKFPRVSTPNSVAAPPRVSPSTTQDFHNIPPTTQKKPQIYSSHQIQNFSKNITFSFSLTQIQVQPSP